MKKNNADLTQSKFFRTSLKNVDLTIGKTERIAIMSKRQNSVDNRAIVVEGLGII